MLLLLFLALKIANSAAAASKVVVQTATATSSSHNGTGNSHQGERCIMGKLLCLREDLRPFLLTALWLLFLVVLLLTSERTEHKSPGSAATDGDKSDAASNVAGLPLSARLRKCCELVFLHGVREYLPTSCLQILLGLACATFFHISGYHVAHLETLDPGLFFHLLLPIIIVNAGLGVEKRHFFFNLPAILAYAVVGTLAIAMVIGYTIYALASLGTSGPFSALRNVTKIEALTFGALISAVDPVAVLALFEKMHLNKPLYMTLFGESVINDAVSVVLYNLFTQAKASMFKSGESEWRPTSLEIGGIVLYSVHVATTGLLVGVTCGVLASALMRVLPNAGNQSLAVLIYVIAGYLSFYWAELISASGILSTFVCSIVMSIYLGNLTPVSQNFLRQSTNSYAEIAEGFIYLVMGVSALNLFFGHSARVIVDVPFIVVTLVLCVGLRFACVYGIGYLLRMISLTDLRASDFFILSYGGLRGSIALALSLMLTREHYTYCDEFFACTMIMVLLTCFINGITLKPLIQLAGIQIDESHDDSLWDQIMNRTCDYIGFFMGGLTGRQTVMKRVYQRWNLLNDRYLRRALLKSKVYRESNEEGIYELHRKIVADEFLKFATRTKSLIDLTALRSDSVVFAIRRVSSMSNSNISHSQSHHSLRQSLSVSDALHQLEVPPQPVLDLQVLDGRLAGAERSREDLRSHYRQVVELQETRFLRQQRSWEASSSSTSRQVASQGGRDLKAAAAASAASSHQHLKAAPGSNNRQQAATTAVAASDLRRDPGVAFTVLATGEEDDLSSLESSDCATPDAPLQRPRNPQAQASASQRHSRTATAASEAASALSRQFSEDCLGGNSGAGAGALFAAPGATRATLTSR